MGLLYPEPTPLAAFTPTPALPKELNVCIGSEPRALYAYKAASSSEREVLQVLTDGPIDILSNGDKRPVLLEVLPSVENGAVTFIPVAVSAGDIVANTTGNLVSLEQGIEVFPSGCTSPACALVWDGASPLQVDQLVVNYQLKEDLKWSDGQPLTADDSVFSFRMAADPLTPISKQYVDLTQSYKALDVVTLEWMGIPGFVTIDLENFFWAPLPYHALREISAADLLEDETANRMPLSYGPFMIDAWQAGENIRLIKNPFYHRAAEGLPAIDALTFRFLSASDPTSLLTAAQSACDIVSPSALGMQDILYLQENAEISGMQLIDLPPVALEIIAFGITPSSFDDNNYNLYRTDRSDLFGDVRVRQAIAQCIDRQAIVNMFIADGMAVADGMLHSDHPLMEDFIIKNHTYDPQAGMTLLKEVGWQDADFDSDTPLSAANVNNVLFGTPFEIDLLTSTSPLRVKIATEIAANLSACGIQVNLTPLPLSDLYQPAPDGPLFGRKFDLALISLQTGSELDCRWFSADEIPAESNYWLGTSTGGANFFGYQNPEYDAQCSQNQRSSMDISAKSTSLKNAVSILANDLPAIPLYFYPRALLVRENVCGFSDDAPLREGLIYIEQFGMEEGC